jgi:HEAT repeat protein
MDEPRQSDGSAPSPICRAFVLKLGRTSDKTARQRILAACARLDRGWAEELLWETLADSNEAVRDLAVRALCERQTLRTEWALRRLRLPPWYARSSALAVIGRRRLRQALPGLAAAVGDPNVEVRRAAAEALGEMGGNEAVRLLVQLKKDASPYVRTAAEEAIEKARGVRII